MTKMTLFTISEKGTPRPCNMPKPLTTLHPTVKTDMSPRVDWLLRGSSMSHSTSMAYAVMSKYAHTDNMPSCRYMSRKHTMHEAQTGVFVARREERRRGEVRVRFWVFVLWT
jgi:hypothetical protein